MDGDVSVRAVLGNGERGHGRCDPLQRPRLRGRTQAGPEGEDGLRVRVWKAAGSR